MSIRYQGGYPAKFRLSIVITYFSCFLHWQLQWSGISPCTSSWPSLLSSQFTPAYNSLTEGKLVGVFLCSQQIPTKKLYCKCPQKTCFHQNHVFTTNHGFKKKIIDVMGWLYTRSNLQKYIE